MNLLDKAIQLRELADKTDQQRDEISQTINNAPDRLEKIKAEIDQPIPAPDVIETEASAMSTVQLEQRLHQEESDSANVQNALKDLNSQLSKHKNLMLLLPETVAKVRKQLQELQAEWETISGHQEDSLLTEAQRFLNLAEKSKLHAEVKLYELQTASQDLLLSLITAERDLMSRDVAKRKASIKIWQDQVQRRRQQEALRVMEAAEEAKIKAPDMPMVLKVEFDINIELGAALKELIRDEAEVAKGYLPRTNLPS